MTLAAKIQGAYPPPVKRHRKHLVLLHLDFDMSMRDWTLIDMTKECCDLFPGN
jgi:hypothetical protein